MSYRLLKKLQCHSVFYLYFYLTAELEMGHSSSWKTFIEILGCLIKPDSKRNSKLNILATVTRVLWQQIKQGILLLFYLPEFILRPSIYMKVSNSPLYLAMHWFFILHCHTSNETRVHHCRKGHPCPLHMN